MFTSAEISRWVSAVWRSSDAAFPIRGISHDTRTLQAGDVYLAISGAVHDGHDFVKQAVDRGAVGLIVEREFPRLHVAQLVVSDALNALWKMAEGVRREWTGTVIGITGSVGKTTVKELVAAVLAQRGCVAKTRGNWNNEIGLPLSMLAANRAADFFVFELGMNHPGEIEPLANLLRPEWALITNVSTVHTEFFQPAATAPPPRDVDAWVLGEIADEKAAILKPASIALLDEESEWFERLIASFSGSVVTLTDLPFDVAQPGAHMVQNARFAATLGLAMGLSAEEVQAGLDSFRPAPMRWEQHDWNGVLLINDAYNASPLSMRASLTTFSQLPGTGRTFAVLGGMRELGAAREAEHRALGAFVDSLSFDGVFTIGEAGRAIVCQGARNVEKEAAVQLLREILRPGDKVIFKASRGEQLETILEALNS